MSSNGAPVGEVEDLFDTSDDSFEIRQLGYVNVRRLFAQLSAGLPRLDAAIHEAVQADIEFGNSIVLPSSTPPTRPPPRLPSRRSTRTRSS